MELVLRGRSASPGAIRGNARVFNKIHTSSTLEIKEGEILVVPFLTPHHFEFIIKAGAIVTDYGGVTSHAASIARELGIPCVVATEKATVVLKTGIEVFVDGDEGTVYQ